MAQLRISFVTTAHAAIGTGHLRRCLTLSDELRSAGAGVSYWIYEGDAQVRRWLDGRCDAATVDRSLTLVEAVRFAAADPLVVVDSYDARSPELTRLAESGARVLVMDDLADRELPATWVLNSCIRDAAAYRNLTKAALLLGPAHALLRPQFRALPVRAVRETVTRVLLTFGGSDPLGLTGRILRLLEHRREPMEIRVVTGLLAESDIPISRRHQVEVLRDVEDMASLMLGADVALAAAGQTVFELAACGCPALCLQVADNQRYTGALVQELGAASVRDARTVTDAQLAGDIDRLWRDAALRREMSRAGQSAVDGGGVRRVSAALMASFGPGRIA